MSRQKVSSRAALSALALAAAFVSTLSFSTRRAAAAPGDLDPSFDADGKVTTDFAGGTDRANAVAVQPDGKIVVAGAAASGGQSVFALARYNSDGSLDQSFGAGGRVTTPFSPGADERAQAVALQPDGKIVAVGSSNTTVVVARYNADGTVDQSFGTGGRVADSSGVGRAVVLQPDGKIVVAGAAGAVCLVLRYQPNGTRDAAFGTNGESFLDFRFSSTGAHAIALQPDGKIVVVGESATDFAVGRFNADGGIDVTFNTGGRQVVTSVTNPLGNRMERATAVLVQPGGRIVVAGMAQTGLNSFGFGVVGLRTDGNLDPAFGPNGNGRLSSNAFVRFSVPDQRVALAAQPNGKFVLVAYASHLFGVARFNANGTTDPTFGNNGTTQTDFTSDQLDEPEAVAVQPDGRVVVAGVANEPNGDFALARYLGDAPDVQCSYGLSRVRHTAPAGGGASSVHVFAAPGCAWAAVSNADWISLTPQNAGAGSGQLNFTVEPTAGGLRFGTISVAGQTLTVGQNGVKVVVYYSGGTALAERVRDRLAATGTLAQVDDFTIDAATPPTLSHLLQYDAALYFHNAVTGPSRPNQTGMGDVLADYSDAGRGVVIAGFNWDEFIPTHPISGRLRFGGLLPITPGGTVIDGAGFVKRQPAHPIFEGVSAVGEPLVVNTQAAPDAERLADWGDGSVAVAVKRPNGRRIAGLNYLPGSQQEGADLPRLTANALRWTAAAGAHQSTIQFAASSFAANEGDGGAIVTVTRAGDLSDAARVEVSTADDQTPVRCDTDTGIAYARCDYETTVAVAHFAPGETTKTARVPVVNDTHVEGPEVVHLRLRRAYGAALAPQAAATLNLADDDTADQPNPYFSHPFFVRQHYLDFLAREPEEPGQTAWINVLANCPDLENDTRCDRATVSSSFFRSVEFELRGGYVFRFYRAAFGRLPEYGEFVADLQAVGGASASEVFRNRAAFAEAFVERPEFLTDVFRPNLTTREALVNTLMDRYDLQTIHTTDPANPEGGQEVALSRADLVNRLEFGILTRGQVLRAIADSAEVRAREFNGAFVAMQYYGYLRRTPEQPGYQNWLNYLNANPNDSRTMVKGFINSVEYKLRFGQP